MWEVDSEWYQQAKTFHSGLKLLSGLLIILFFTALFARNASAAVVQENYRYDGVVWGISDVEFHNNINYLNVRQGCIVNAPNAFSAACYAVGGNPLDLTSEQRALLSNASTGGDFYTFSQLFANYGGSFDLPDWEYVNFFDLWSKYESLYGDALYAADFSQAQLKGARADYQTILNGGSSGGGGGGGLEHDSDYYYLDMELTGFSVDYYQYSYSGFAFPVDFWTALVSKYDGWTQYDFKLWVATSPSANNAKAASSLCFVQSCPTLNWLTSAGNYSYNWPVGDRAYMAFRPLSGDVTHNGKHYMIANVSPSNVNGMKVEYGGAVMDWARATYMYYYGSIDGVPDNGQPTLPPTNWPDNPTVTAPEPPELPDPYNPTIDDQPIDPTPPQNPIYPPILSITEETYTADLQGILDAMDAHCQHLRSALHTEMSNLWTALSTKMTNDFATFRTYMTGQIGWLGDLISDEMQTTRDYLQDLFEWLADEFSYTFSDTAYNDNTLISWLRKIYYRLGSGGVNTRPVDPVANPIDAGDWLSQLIANLFTALNALAGGLLTSVGSALDLMHSKFPFSLPWDLLAILALFEAPPTAPDFDVPIYTVSSAGQLLQVGAWEIDLSDLSPYLEGIRWMQKICFVYFLAVHTKDWMDMLEKVVA